MTMQIALLHADYDPAHLESVKAEMATRGAPTVRAVWMEAWGVWAALEGCHRLRAAHALGLVPEIEAVEYSEEATTEDLGMTRDFQGDVWTVAQLVDDACTKPILAFA